MRRKIRVAAAACLIWSFIAASFLAEASNVNASGDIALLPDISALEGAPQSNLSQVLGQNYSGYIAEIPQNPSSEDAFASGTADYRHPPHQDQLWIVDYLGNPYPCGEKCVFSNDLAEMVAIPCTSGLLKLYEKYPDQNVVESPPFPVYANMGYYRWFIGDVAGLHTLWFTIEDFYGQVTRSNDVIFHVMIENCSPIANCSPSFRPV